MQEGKEYVSAKVKIEAIIEKEYKPEQQISVGKIIIIVLIIRVVTIKDFYSYFFQFHKRIFRHFKILQQADWCHLFIPAIYMDTFIVFWWYKNISLQSIIMIIKNIIIVCNSWEILSYSE